MTAVLALLLAMWPVGPRDAAGQEPSGPAFSKVFSPSTIAVDEVSTLTFTIAGQGLPAGNAAFTDVLPNGLVIATPANASTDCTNAVLSAPAGGGTIAFSEGRIGSGQTCTVVVDVTSSTAGSYENTSSVLSYNGGSTGPAVAVLEVTAAATDRPTFSKEFVPGQVFFGGRSTLTFTIDNSASASAVASAAFVDDLPAGLVVADPANVVNGCDAGVVTAVPGSGTISLSTFGFPNQNVAANASCSISVDVDAGAIGTLENVTGELTSTGPSGGQLRSSGVATAQLTVLASPLQITKRFVDDPVVPGGTGTLEFTILNTDRTAAATDVAFTDDLDAALSGLVAAALPPTEPCGAGSVLTGTSELTLSGGVIPAAGSCTFSVTVQVPAGSAAVGVHTNTTSAVTGMVGDQLTTGNAASDDLFVVEAPVLTKSFTDDPVGAGGTVTLEFTIENPSADFAATDVAFSDELPIIVTTSPSGPPTDDFCGAGSAATFTPRTNPPGPSSAQPARIVVTGVSIDPGGTCTFSLTLAIAAGAPAGIHPNTTSEVTATLDGSSVTGAPASDDLLVVAAPSVRKVFIDDPVVPGDPVTLEFTISNGNFLPDGSDLDAVGPAGDITFTDDLGFVAGLTATGLPAEDICGPESSLTLSSGNVLTFAGGSLAEFETCTFAVTLQTSASTPQGTHTNTTGALSATVSGAAVSDPGAEDDLVVAALVVTKEFTDDPVLAGEQVTLEFTIDNSAGAEDATDIGFRDDLGDAVSGLVPSAAGPTLLTEPCGPGSSLTLIGSDILELSGASVGDGQSCTFSVLLDVPSGAQADTYGNATSAVTATIGGSAVVLPAATDDLVVEDPVEIGLTKEFLDIPVLPGDLVTLELTISNPSSTQSVTGIAFTDDLGAALSGLAATGLPPSDICGVGSLLTGTGLLSFSGGSLAPGAECTFAVTLKVPADAAPGTYTNTTSAVSADDGVTGPAASADLSVNPAPREEAALLADLSIIKVDAVDPVDVGDTLTYVIRVRNNGPARADNVVVNDSLPSDVSFVSSSTGCTEDPENELTCMLGNIPAGGSVVYTVDVTVDSTSSTLLTNTATVSSSVADPVPGNNSASEDTTVNQADLSITKDADADAVDLDDTLVYTVTVNNAGPSTAENVVVEDTLPANVALVATSGCDEDLAGTPTCTLGDIAAGGSASYTIEVTVESGTLEPFTNTATVGSDTNDPNPGNNSDDVTTQFNTADLSITKSDDSQDGFVGEGYPLTYTVTVDNAGPSTAVKVVVTDTLPAGVTLVSTSGCAEDPGGVPTCTLGDIAAGGSASYTIEVTVDVGTMGTLTNEASVSSDTFDPNSSNDDAALDTEVVPVSQHSNLSITKTSPHYEVEEDSTFSYTVTVANDGPADATGVIVEDSLPDGVNFIPARACVEGPPAELTCDLGTIRAGRTKTIKIRVEVLAPPGVITNVASVSSTSFDPDLSDNTDTEENLVREEQDDGGGGGGTLSIRRHVTSRIIY